MIAFDEARGLVLSAAALLPPVSCPLGAAAGKVLREELAADLDVPPFDATAMDGWAVRAAEVRGATEGAPVTLKVAGGIGAGSVPRGPLPRGSALKVMTGAPLPKGADAIVPVEQAREAPDGASVALLEAAAPGAHVRCRGEVIRTGKPLLSPGRLLTPADLVLAVSAGRDSLLVAPRPRASVLVTGDEIVPAGTRPGPGKIRNTNAPLLLGALGRAGAEAADLGCCRDDAALLHEVLGRALEEGPDLLLTTGGVSAGDYDLVGDVLSALGCEVLFHRVAIRPAKPVLFARRGPTLVFGLPGNPVSTAVAYDLLVLPALRTLAGTLPAAPPPVEARLSHPVRNAGGRLAFLPGRVSFEAGRVAAEPVPTRGSHDVAAHAASNAYLVVPPRASLAAGEAVEAYLAGPGTTLG